MLKGFYAANFNVTVRRIGRIDESAMLTQALGPGDQHVTFSVQ